MKTVAGILFFWLAILFFSRAQDNNTISLPDLMQGAQQWAQQNLDTNLLNSLPAIDDAQVQDFTREIQKDFSGDYIVDLASLRQVAQTILPLLQSRADTQPYAAWLRAQMPYLEFADEINLTIPPPKNETNAAEKNFPSVAQTNLPPPTILNPPPQKERELWVKKVSTEPWPENAKKIVPELKPIFAAQKVPPDLVWLAEVESDFDRSAKSPAGAAGLFQLMPETAKRFGLSLWPRDERYQPEPSASASAQYLKLLHKEFGDWRLSLAAYNCGEGTVQKLLERYHTRNYDDIAAHLPAETQMYVPRVEAVIQEREGAKLESL
jgi:membrane-bound lytic murein transglycosylase D